jgi:hypothetical protein
LTSAREVAAPPNNSTRHNIAGSIFFLIDISPEAESATVWQVQSFVRRLSQIKCFIEAESFA